MAEPERIAFRKWLTDNYPFITRPTHIGEYKNHPYFNYWKQYVEVKPKQVDAPFGFPDVKANEYKNKLEVILKQLVERGELTESEADEAELLTKNRLTLEGVHSGLPYFNEIITPLMGRFTAGEQQKATQRWQASQITPGQLISPKTLERMGVFKGLSPEAEKQARLEAENRFNMGVWQAGQAQQAGTKRWQEQQGNLAFQRQLNFQAQEEQRIAERDTQRLGLLQTAENLVGDVLRQPRNWIQLHFAEEAQRKLRWEANLLRPGFRGEEKAERGRQGAFQDVRARTFERGGLGQYTIPSEAPSGFQGGKRVSGGGGFQEKPLLAPGWLTQWVPGLEVGERLGNAPVTPASGQLWARTPFTERQGLAGYLNWTRGQGAFQEFQEDIARRQPLDPRRTATRWTPARQI